MNQAGSIRKYKPLQRTVSDVIEKLKNISQISYYKNTDIF